MTTEISMMRASILDSRTGKKIRFVFGARASRPVPHGFWSMAPLWRSECCRNGAARRPGFPWFACCYVPLSADGKPKMAAARSFQGRPRPVKAAPGPAPYTNFCPADSTDDEYKERNERMEYIQSPRHFAVIKTGPARSGVRRLVAALRSPIVPHTGGLPPGFASTPLLPSRVLRGPCSRAASRPVWRLTEAEQAATSRRTPERAAAT